MTTCESFYLLADGKTLEQKYEDLYNLFLLTRQELTTLEKNFQTHIDATYKSSPHGLSEFAENFNTHINAKLEEGVHGSKKSEIKLSSRLGIDGNSYVKIETPFGDDETKISLYPYLTIQEWGVFIQEDYKIFQSNFNQHINGLLSQGVHGGNENNSNGGSGGLLIDFKIIDRGEYYIFSFEGSNFLLTDVLPKMPFTIEDLKVVTDFNANNGELTTDVSLYFNNPLTGGAIGDSVSGSSSSIISMPTYDNIRDSLVLNYEPNSEVLSIDLTVNGKNLSDSTIFRGNTIQDFNLSLSGDTLTGVLKTDNDSFSDSITLKTSSNSINQDIDINPNLTLNYDPNSGNLTANLSINGSNTSDTTYIKPVEDIEIEPNLTLNYDLNSGNLSADLTINGNNTSDTTYIKPVEDTSINDINNLPTTINNINNNIDTIERETTVISNQINYIFTLIASLGSGGVGGASGTEALQRLDELAITKFTLNWDKTNSLLSADIAIKGIGQAYTQTEIELDNEILFYDLTYDKITGKLSSFIDIKKIGRKYSETEIIIDMNDELLQKIYSALGGDTLWGSGSFDIKLGEYIENKGIELYDEDNGEPQTITINNIFDAISYNNSATFKRLGLDKLPADVPKNLNAKIGSDEASEIEKQLSFLDLWLWDFKQMDARIGKFPVQIKIEDTDLVKEGNQSLDLEIRNLSELTTETLGLLIVTKSILEANLSATVRTLGETGASRVQGLTTYRLLETIQAYLNFKTKQKKTTIEMSYNPATDDNLTLAEVLDNTEQQVIIEEFDDDKSLPDLIAPLLQSAAIIKAQNFRKFDLDFLKGFFTNSKDALENSDDFDQFLEKVERGFIDESNIKDPQNPYGRNYENRPKIVELGVQSDEQA